MKVYFKIINTLVVIIFLGVLLLPSINEGFHLIKEEEGTENRTKALKPLFEKDSLEKFVKNYDLYYTDNFNLRNNFIKFLNQFEFSIFGTSPVPDEIVVGKHGWFYLANCVPNYKGINLFTEKQLIQYKNELKKRTRWAAKRGIKYYLAIIPNKMNVYPEYLPSKIINVSEKTRYDQIVALNNDTSINIIDIKKNLLKHKNDGYDLYQHTDDHWNDLGAYYGYEAIMSKLCKDFPELKGHELHDYKIEIKTRTGNLANMISMDKDYPENFIQLTEKYIVNAQDGIKRGYTVPKTVSDWDFEIIKVNSHGKKLKCLVIRDSFTIYMIKYLQEHFKETVFIHSEWLYQMHEDLIWKEKPDIILNIMLETGLNKIIEFPFKPSVSEKQIHLKASNNKYVCAASTNNIIANRQDAGLLETYTLIKYDKNECAILAYNNFFLSSNLGSHGEITAGTEKLNGWEKFSITKLNNGYVAFKAYNGKYLSLNLKTNLIFAKGDSIGVNEKFKLEILNK